MAAQLGPGRGRRGDAAEETGELPRPAEGPIGFLAEPLQFRRFQRDRILLLQRGYGLRAITFATAAVTTVPALFPEVVEEMAREAAIVLRERQDSLNARDVVSLALLEALADLRAQRAQAIWTFPEAIA